MRILYLADIRFPLERANGIQSMEQAGLPEQFIRAMKAAQARARELGDEFGR